MRVDVWCDELWPYYDISEGGSTELPDEFVEEWRALKKRFGEMQDELEKHYVFEDRKSMEIDFPGQTYFHDE